MYQTTYLVHTRTSLTPKTGLRFRQNGGQAKAVPCSCYPDGAFTVSEQTVTLTFDTEGKLIGYSENTILKQGDSDTENSYRVDLYCKEHNAVEKIEAPQLRERFGQAK